MVAGKRLVRVSRMVRVCGLMAIAGVALASAPRTLCGDEDCVDYTISECMAQGLCEMDEGKECGEAIGFCSEKGKIHCVVRSGCETDQVDKKCIFETAN